MAAEVLGLPPRLGLIYLTALAEIVAGGNQMSPVTDDPRIHRAAGSTANLSAHLLGVPVDQPAVHEPVTAYLHLAIQATIQPKRLSTVPVAKLLKFRERHAPELAAFRDHVAALGDELQNVASITDAKAARAHLASLYKTRTKPQLDELRRALRGLGISSTAGTLGLKFDLTTATGTALGGLAAAIGQPVVAGAAAALTILPYVTGHLTRRRELRTHSPVTYLLAADRKLNSPALLRALRN